MSDTQKDDEAPSKNNAETPQNEATESKDVADDQSTPDEVQPVATQAGEKAGKSKGKGGRKTKKSAKKADAANDPIVLLFAGHGASDLERIEDREFTTLRVGRKWYDTLMEAKASGVGPLIINAHRTDDDPDKPDAPSKAGEHVGAFEVIGVDLVPYYSQALAVSAFTEHLCLLGSSRSKLDEVITALYTTEKIAAVSGDPDDGFTIISLKRVA
jgi:hypothetical protein